MSSEAPLPEMTVYSAEFVADAHAVIREVRAEGPIATSERGIELLSYSLCEQALRDPRFAVGFDEMMAATGTAEDRPTRSS